MFGYSKKKNRVGCEVILERMRQEAHRRRGEGRPAECWAPSLTDSVTGLQDIRVECDQDDPERLWRLGVLLEEARKEANKQRLWNEILHDAQYRMGVKTGEDEREIKRLQEENHALREISLVKMTTMVVKDLQDNELSAPLCCPITHELFKDPVVSRFGHSFSREDIEKWLKKKLKCPLTNQYMTKSHMAPNRVIADVVEAFRAQQL